MKNRFHRKVIYFLLRVLSILVLRLNEGTAEALGAILGDLGFFCLAKKRRTALFNLTFALGKEKSLSEIRLIAREVFRNLGKNLIEVFRFPLLNAENIDRLVSSSGLERIDEALKKGKGAIILSSHFGNWELLGAYFSLKGYPANVVARRIYFAPYQRLLSSLRRGVGMNVIERQGSPRRALEVLKKNQLLGIVPDQDVDSVNGVFVDFFRKPAYTPIAPVSFALASGAPLIPCFLLRKKGRHHLAVEKPLELEEAGDKKETLIRNTERWSKITESYIRRYPEQWVWMHERWKTRPGDDRKR